MSADDEDRLAALAMRIGATRPASCPSIVFGTGVLPLPNYHPVMAASQVAMVDHLVDGRLLLGIGPGVPADAEAIGDLGTDRRQKTIDALDHMLRLWSEEPPFHIDGEFHHTSTERHFDPDIGVGAMVRPLQRPHPPIVVTSIRPDSEGPHEAGSHGWSGISAAYVGRHVLKAHLDGYKAGRKSAGLPSEPTGWRIARSIFVADDEETARRYAHLEQGTHGFYFRVMLTKLGVFGGQGVMLDHPEQSGAELTLERALRRLVIVGTPESVAQQILALGEEVGAFGVLLYTGHDWVEPALARRSMELMATEVALLGPGVDSDAITLNGEGAYDGLTAYVVMDFATDPVTFNAAIFPGEMPTPPEPREAD